MFTTAELSRANDLRPETESQRRAVSAIDAYTQNTKCKYSVGKQELAWHLIRRCAFVILAA